MKFLYFSLVLLFISGCATTKQYVPTPDVSEQIPKDRAVIELHRTYSLFGAARGVDIRDNGKIIGDLRNDSKLLWERGVGTMMCLHAGQWEKTVSEAVVSGLMGDDALPDNCFNVRGGEINKFKFIYMGSGFLTQEKWLKKQSKDE